MNDQEMQNLPFTLNAQQVADVLGIARNSAYTLMHSEGFPTIHIGKRLLVPRDKLLQWIVHQTQ